MLPLISRLSIIQFYRNALLNAAICTVLVSRDVNCQDNENRVGDKKKLLIDSRAYARECILRAIKSPRKYRAISRECVSRRNEC